MTHSTTLLFLLFIALHVVCLCASGVRTPEWLNAMGGTGTDQSLDSVVDSNGNVIITGSFQGTASFNGTQISSNGGTDIFLASYQSNGSLNWVKSFGGTNDDAGTAVVVDPSGNIFLTGYVFGVGSFDGFSYVAIAGRDLFVARVNAQGVTQWVKSAGSIGNDEAYGIVLDNAGDLYITGGFSGAITWLLSTTIVNIGSSDIFLIKYAASNGDFQYAKRFGGSGPDYGLDLAIDSSNNVVLVGYYSGSFSFGSTSVTSVGNSDIFVVKLDSAGNVLWAKTAGTTGEDKALSVSVSPSGNIGVAGYFSASQISFGSIVLNSNGGNDGFILQYSSAGLEQWGKSIGGVQNDSCRGSAFDSSTGNLCVSGDFSATTVFGGVSVTSEGYSDVFSICYNSLGEQQYLATAGGTGIDTAYSLTVIPGQYLFVAGSFEGTLHFGQTSVSAIGSNDVYLAKVSLAPIAAESIEISPSTNAVMSPDISHVAESSPALLSNLQSFSIQESPSLPPVHLSSEEQQATSFHESTQDMTSTHQEFSSDAVFASPSEVTISSTTEEFSSFDEPHTTPTLSVDVTESPILSTETVSEYYSSGDALFSTADSPQITTFASLTESHHDSFSDQSPSPQVTSQFEYSPLVTESHFPVESTEQLFSSAVEQSLWQTTEPTVEETPQYSTSLFVHSPSEHELSSPQTVELTEEQTLEQTIQQTIEPTVEETPQYSTSLFVHSPSEYDLSSQQEVQEPTYYQPYFTLSTFHQAVYSACEEGIMSVSVMSSQEDDVTALSLVTWSITALENEKYSNVGEPIEISDTSSITLELTRFARGRQYNVTVVAHIDGQQISESFVIEILDFEFNLSISSPLPTVYRRGGTLRLSSQLATETCNPGVSNGQWFMDPIASLPDNVTRQQNLQLPMTLLPVISSNYTIQHKMAVNFTQFGSVYNSRRSNVITSNSASIRLVVAEPRAIISGSSSRTGFVNDVLSFDGRASTDSEGFNSIAKYQWICESCEIVSGTQHNSTVLLKWKTSGSHTLRLIYSVGLRNSSASVTLQILEAGARVPKLSLSLVPNKIVSKRSKLSFTASLEGQRYDQVDFLWVLTKQPNTTIPLTSSVISTSSATHRNIALREGVLESGSSYTMTVRAKNKNETNYIAFSTYEFSTSVAPSGGSFVVEPTTGFALQTNFHLTIADWITDSDALPLSYSIGYYDPLTSKSIILAANSNVTLKLPPGPTVGATLNITATIRNRFGDESHYTTPVVVKPLSSEETEHLLQDITDDLQVEQDSQIILNALPTLAQSLSSVTTSKDQLRKSMLKLLNKTNTVQLTSETVDIKVTVMNSLTSGATISKEERGIVSGILSTILHTRDSASVITKQGLNTIADVVSTVADSGLQSGSLQESQQVVDLVSSIASVSFKTMDAGEDPLVISTNSFEMKTQSDFASSLQNLQITDSSVHSRSGRTSDVTISLPQLQVLQETEEQLFVEFIKFNDGKHPFSYSESSENITSSVVSFKLMRADNEAFSKFSLENLENSIEIRLNKMETNVTRQQQYRYVCQSWDETDSSVDNWSSNGCVYAGETETHIICNCNHTTSFAAFIQYDSTFTLDSLNTGIFIYSIAYYSMVAIISIALFIFIVLNRNSQPIRSRHVVPYVGLVAILAECILQGIIRSSMLLSMDIQKHYKALNIISYIVTCIANPLGLIALSVFLWQMIRYLFMKRLMELLLEGEKRSVIRLVRILTSRLVFVGIVCSVGVSTALYFVTWSAVGGSGVMKASINSVVQSVSYWVLEIAIASCIVAIFVWDYIFHQIKGRKALSTAPTAEDSEGSSSVEYEEKKKKADSMIVDHVKQHFFSNDPLLFRIEAMFMVLSIVALVVAFVLGIIENFSFLQSYEKLDAPLTIARVVFDTIYISLRVLVFGGFISIAHMREMIVHKKSRVAVDVYESSPELFTEIIKVLKHDFGYKLLEDYCTKELSVENVLMWKDLNRTIEVFAFLSQQDRLNAVNRIDEEYIQRYAPFEVNIDGETRKTWQQFVELKDVNNIEGAVKAFKKLDSAVMMNISDTFSRFSCTEDYKRFCRAKDMMLELEDNGFGV